MPLSSSRRVLVWWLYGVAVVHLAVGLLLSWAVHTGWFDSYLNSVERAFWGAAAPAAAREQHIWWLSLFGATLQSYSLYMLALIHLAARYRLSAAWGWLIAGLLLWAPQDILISVQAGVWSHLWVDTFALLVLLPPLFRLYRIDRSFNADSRHA